VTLLERFKSDAAKTRSEVRKELGINGQYSYYYYYSILFLFSSFFHSQFNYFIVKDNELSLLFSLFEY